jgi:hypothetical protein
MSTIVLENLYVFAIVKEPQTSTGDWQAGWTFVLRALLSA